MNKSYKAKIGFSKGRQKRRTIRRQTRREEGFEEKASGGTQEKK